MRACLYYICKTPDVYHQVQEEIDTYYKANNLQRPITYQQTLEMPLLCAVIREAIRMFPAIPYQLLRYAPEGMVISGMKIPIGTPVGMSPIAANRDSAVWGESWSKNRSLLSTNVSEARTQTNSIHTDG